MLFRSVVEKVIMVLFYVVPGGNLICMRLLLSQCFLIYIFSEYSNYTPHSVSLLLSQKKKKKSVSLLLLIKKKKKKVFPYY